MLNKGVVFVEEHTKNVWIIMLNFKYEELLLINHKNRKLASIERESIANYVF